MKSNATVSTAYIMHQVRQKNNFFLYSCLIHLTMISVPQNIIGLMNNWSDLGKCNQALIWSTKFLAFIPNDWIKPSKPSPPEHKSESLLSEQLDWYEGIIQSDLGKPARGLSWPVCRNQPLHLPPTEENHKKPLETENLIMEKYVTLYYIKR